MTGPLTPAGAQWKWACVTRTPLSTLSVYSPAMASLLTRILNRPVVSVSTAGTS